MLLNSGTTNPILTNYFGSDSAFTENSYRIHNVMLRSKSMASLYSAVLR